MLEAPQNTALPPVELTIVPTSDDTAPVVLKLTLDDILSEMQRMERIMDADESQFDPEVILGIKPPAAPVSDEEREQILEALRCKVDSIDYVVSEFEAYAKRTAERAARIAKRAKAAQGRAERLESYMLKVMQAYGFEMLPGDERTVEIKMASNPALIVSREPTADDMLDLPDYVTEVPTSYVWNTKAVKEALLNRAEFSFASLRYKPRLHFEERDKPAVTDKRKGKKEARV